jgi:hypothetical protein
MTMRDLMHPALPPCEGETWGGRCSFSGRWEHAGHFYCQLHRPDRVAHAAMRKQVRVKRDHAKTQLLKAAIEDGDVMAWATHYRDLSRKLASLILEAREKYALHGRFVRVLPRKDAG